VTSFKLGIWAVEGSGSNCRESQALGDRSIVHSYGYELVGITKRPLIFDALPSMPSAAQTPIAVPKNNFSPFTLSLSKGSRELRQAQPERS
jgi:hypothetical protein